MNSLALALLSGGSRSISEAVKVAVTSTSNQVSGYRKNVQSAVRDLTILVSEKDPRFGRILGGEKQLLFPPTVVPFVRRAIADGFVSCGRC